MRNIEDAAVREDPDADAEPAVGSAGRRRRHPHPRPPRRTCQQTTPKQPTQEPNPHLLPPPNRPRHHVLRSPPD